MNPADRKQLVTDVRAYLTLDKIQTKLSEERICQAIRVIEAAAWETVDPQELAKEPSWFPDPWHSCLDWLASNQVNVGDQFYGAIASHFSPPHYEAIVKFVHRFEHILRQEEKAAEELAEQLQNALNQQRYWEQARDDFEFEDLCPDGEIIVEPTRLVARAFVKGLGSQLPKKNRKHLGFGSLFEYGECYSEWEFPLAMLDALNQVGLPLIYHPDSPLCQTSQSKTPSKPAIGLHSTQTIAIPQSREEAEAILSQGCKDGGIRIPRWDDQCPGLIQNLADMGWKDEAIKPGHLFLPVSQVCKQLEERYDNRTITRLCWLAAMVNGVSLQKLRGY